jgi:hypothetical protein
VVEAPEDFGVRTEVKAGEVEERQVVVVADVKEEVGGTSVIPVLEQFDQRKLEDTLIEGDGSLDITGEQGEMMETSRR